MIANCQASSKQKTDETILYSDFRKPSVADKLSWTPQPRTGDEVHYLQFENPYRMYVKKDDNYGNRKFWQSLPISKYYGFPDDFCELDENKSSNRNTARENDTTGENHQVNDCNDENDVKKDEEKQADEDRWHHGHHDNQQNECDQNNEDENHRKIEEELHRQQNSDEEHHRQDAEKLQQLQKSHQSSHSN